MYLSTPAKAALTVPAAAPPRQKAHFAPPQWRDSPSRASKRVRWYVGMVRSRLRHSWPVLGNCLTQPDTESARFSPDTALTQPQVFDTPWHRFFFTYLHMDAK